jgi:hypothetical protein
MSSGSSHQAVERWHAALRLFRLRRAVGGHANDGDMLHATLRFSGEDELVALFARLERPLVRLPPTAAVPVAGQSYTLDEYEALRHPIRAFPGYEDPSRTKLFGVSCYVTVGEGELGVSLSGAGGDPYLVSEGDFEHALAIERALDERGLLPRGAA